LVSPTPPFVRQIWTIKPHRGRVRLWSVVAARIAPSNALWLVARSRPERLLCPANDGYYLAQLGTGQG